VTYPLSPEFWCMIYYFKTQEGPCFDSFPPLFYPESNSRVRSFHPNRKELPSRDRPEIERPNNVGLIGLSSVNSGVKKTLVTVSCALGLRSSRLPYSVGRWECGINTSVIPPPGLSFVGLVQELLVSFYLRLVPCSLAHPPVRGDSYADTPPHSALSP